MLNVLLLKVLHFAHTVNFWVLKDSVLLRDFCTWNGASLDIGTKVLNVAYVNFSL